MFSNKAIRTVGVGWRQSQSFRKLAVSAIAGALALASVSLHAINIDLTATNKPTVATYAKETLLTSSTRSLQVNRVEYYSVTVDIEAVDAVDTTPAIARDDSWVVLVGLGGSIPADVNAVIRVDLENALLAETPTVTVVGVNESPTPTVVRGGSGLSSMLFRVSGAATATTDTEDRDPTLMIDLGETLNILGDAPVSITAKVTLEGFTEFIDPIESDYPSAIIVASGLSVDSTATNQEVSVADKFRSFKGAKSLASLGDFSLSAAMKVLNAMNSRPVTLAELITPGSTSGRTPSGSFLALEGNFSFAKGVELQDVADACTTIPQSGLLMRDADTMAVLPIERQAIPTTGGEDNASLEKYSKMLCIQLYDGDEAMVVPTTTPYSVTLDFDGLMDALSPPADQALSLGRITRDGTTAYIPYLSTYEGYNHRITLSNRGGREVGYSIDFRPEEGVTAMRKADADGTLMAGETKILKATDVVEIMGMQRTAATVTLVAPKGTIDVSTTLVNKATGTAVVTWAEQEE